MDIARFSKIQTTEDGQPIVNLLTSPRMTEDVGFLSLVDAGANLREFAVVKGGERGSWVSRFLAAVGLGSVAARLTEKEGEPLTFDGAITAQRLSRARWEATDALWDVIRNVLESDLEDKSNAIKLALGQFSTMVLGLVEQSTASKRDELLAALPGLDAPAGVATKAGRVLSARNVSTLQAAIQALTDASAALTALLDTATTEKGREDDMNPKIIAEIATQAADTAIKVAKSAGVSDAAELARIGAAASGEVFKAAVAGPAQPAMPSDALAGQMAQSRGMGAQAQDPHALLTAALASVATLATKVDSLADRFAAVEGVINGHGDEAPGLLAIASKAVDAVGDARARLERLEGTPSAPRGGAPQVPRVASKGEAPDPWAGSAFDFRK